jgi:hypothetical protein
MKSQHVLFVKLKRNNPKNMDFRLKKLQKQPMPWDRLCKIKSKVKGVKILPLKAIIMIDLATGWFEIKQYDEKSISVANIAC